MVLFFIFYYLYFDIRSKFLVGGKSRMTFVVISAKKPHKRIPLHSSGGVIENFMRSLPLDLPSGAVGTPQRRNDPLFKRHFTVKKILFYDPKIVKTYSI